MNCAHLWSCRRPQPHCLVDLQVPRHHAQHRLCMTRGEHLERHQHTHGQTAENYTRVTITVTPRR